jgi:hypothetical protein
MRSKAIPILALLLAALVLQGESCLVEQRTVSAVLGTSIPAEFTSMGFTEGSGEDSTEVLTIDAGAEIIAALDDADIDVEDIKSIAITGGCYEVTASSGHDARRAGAVYIDGNRFLTFDVPTNAAGTTGSTLDGTLALDAAGVMPLNDRLNTYLTDLKNGNPAPFMIAYQAEWTSTPPPTEADPDNFMWTTCVTLQVEYEWTVDVPDPF